MSRHDEDPEYTFVSGEFRAHTDKAVLIKDAGGDEVWIPKSVILDSEILGFEDFEKGDEIIIEVAEWFCEKEELA